MEVSENISKVAHLEMSGRCSSSCITAVFMSITAQCFSPFSTIIMLFLTESRNMFLYSNKMNSLLSLWPKISIPPICKQ
jgi:hypothetical protein